MHLVEYVPVERQLEASLDRPTERQLDGNPGSSWHSYPKIMGQLYKWARDHVMRGVINGFPQWYKDQLAAQQFKGRE